MNTTLYVIQFDAGNIDGPKWVDLSAPYHDGLAADKRIMALAARNKFLHYRLVKRVTEESVLADFESASYEAILDKQ